MTLAVSIDAGDVSPRPFSAFFADLKPQAPLRAAITAHYRADEAAMVSRLAAEALLSTELAGRVERQAVALVEALRTKGSRGAVEGLVREYDLSSQEGIALMCLAEALLRIPDRATRDALIRDKLSGGDWQSHVGHSPSLFVNAATWGLVVTGKLVATVNETGLATALTRLIARGGEPVIRLGVDMAMRMMGEQFVTGQTIGEALTNARRLEAKGFRYSYDMLGEAATTAADAARYLADYEQAIHAIGKAANGRGIYVGPGISIKLSALHPRYSRLQRDRVMGELLPRVIGLAQLAKSYDIGLNIDAEETDRLELSLDLLEALANEPSLKGWNGIGFVVQAYQKRAPFVLDWIIDLARRSGHRIMVRLVKGAYWDSEIKRAQVDGLEGFPVYTRKVHTDVSYLACARKLLANRDVIFPQFATHNAQTVAAVHAMAGEAFKVGDYEFQCLHGMGEPLYEEVVGADKLDRPCRIYAPVGTHETLLAYLVRRLLENGANSSFVNRIQDPAVAIGDLAADPVKAVLSEAKVGHPHPRIRLPIDLYGTRRNSTGVDFSNEDRLVKLGEGLAASLARMYRAAPPIGQMLASEAVVNPADHSDIVGTVVIATPEVVDAAIIRASAAADGWQATPPSERAAILRRAADRMETRGDELLGLIVREAGKSLANAVAEVREAVDFLRYYADRVQTSFLAGTPALGPIACISPWNFPLAIFTGQVAAALAAGNPVLAKPAEETPLIAAVSVSILHDAGIPENVLQLLPGEGDVGARLVADPRICGVMFTGSTEVARLIQKTLSRRLNPDGRPVPLIAETGGQNALIVDSSALAEQVVADVIASAFDSAGQRCSALRVLCLQDDVADRVLTMLKGALAELTIGNPDRLSTDIGPVISTTARDMIVGHIEAMRAKGYPIHQQALPVETSTGTFVAPTIIELPSLTDLTREVFGPVLHVLRYRRDSLNEVLAGINATGYGLTFGIHSRIDETINAVTGQVGAGNIYVNRNLIGAVVGVQPFGGNGLSGTGPKAGGPHYLHRLAHCPAPAGELDPRPRELAGPVGERNLYSVEPRGRVVCIAADGEQLTAQVRAATSVGNRALVLKGQKAQLGRGAWLDSVSEISSIDGTDFDAVLFDGPTDDLMALNRQLATRAGAIVGVHTAGADGDYPREWLVRERSVSINTTAAGGNANLMMIG
jgi:RHH-type proline utilization regulon transcriptional repressor/proline dehydrogenase/delta 1-pyrroline-5-carboxylate dehydrogenase